ncbi:hypothetical protein EMIHUDRAFT_361441, partial [Emiliania huxleyi CCMP1516]|uniref:Uncharacterized protein n=2 Tax=Emiliania huxleyi TaxID=2903 RepID=A0A0D3KTC0_EMIH1
SHRTRCCRWCCSRAPSRRASPRRRRPRRRRRCSRRRCRRARSSSTMRHPSSPKSTDPVVCCTVIVGRARALGVVFCS